jgi:cysteine-rich repeat protein
MWISYPDCDQYGCSSSESEQILYEVTLFQDNSVHIASARAPGGSLAMLTNGIGEIIVRFGLSHISTIIPATAGCGMGDAPRPCSLMQVSGQNISSTVDSLSKFRSHSRPLVVRHLSKNSAQPWHMPFSMTWWNGFSPAWCGNGLLDAPEMILYSETCIVTNATERVCRRNITIPALEEAGELILVIEVKTDMFADWGSSITDIYIDGFRRGGNYLSDRYDRVCGEQKQIAEFAVLSEQAPRDVVVEIHFLHENFWTYVPGNSDEMVPYVPCYCSRCTRRVLDSLIIVKKRNPVEECDDANRADGDGCSALCLVEPGASCDGASREKGPSVCSGGSGEASCSNRCLVEVPQNRMNWGQDPRYLRCTLPLTWKEIHQARFSNCSLSYKTGGLGNLQDVEAFESWLCAHDHPCASNYPWDTYFCFVYDEMRQTFIPWGENAELHLVDT